LAFWAELGISRCR